MGFTEMIETCEKAGIGCDVVSESTVVKRSVYIDGQKTSISLEDAFWNALGDIASAHSITRRQILEQVDKQRQGNLSSALRTFALGYYRSYASLPRK
jgi:predicted DNA-binding ribbon-helix-helix protein